MILGIPAGLLSLLVLSAILWLTLAPQPLPDNDLPLFPGADKVVHALMFGGLYFILALDLAMWRLTRRGGECRKAPAVGKPKLLPASWAFVFALFACLFGGGIELAQGAMGMGRGCDILDFYADVGGVLLSVSITPPILRLLFGTRGQS